MSYYSAVGEWHLAAARSEAWNYRHPLEQMSPALDDLSLKFAIYTRTAKFDALDIGCGEGIAAAAALTRGGHVMAVDPDQAALHQLLARVPPEQYRRLKVRVGSLPTLDFKFARFSAVHAARVFHLIEPEVFRESLRKFFRWLYPAGKLFLSALAPSGAYWAFAQTDFKRRRMTREQWPGYIADLQRLSPAWRGDVESVHLLDQAVIQRELEAAGFVIEYLKCYPLPWDNDQNCCAVIASCAQ
jgi:SAM-dependent methyltransferase